MLNEFKEFIAKGNVMELAVAVIIAGAFAIIVASLTDDMIMPIVGSFLARRISRTISSCCDASRL